MAYQTKQGKALLDYLRNQGSRHVSVREIAQGLPEPMGTATIYRQLEKLAERGLVQKYMNDGGPACFQYVGEKGEACGTLIHLECQEMTRLLEHIDREHGFRTDLTRSAFYGVCAECRKQEAAE